MISAEQILANLKHGEYHPVYLLHGTESYFIDQISDHIEENALNDMEKAFNQLILYGRDTDYQAVIDNARRYPVGAPRQVIIIKEAQDMKTLAELTAYVEQPAPMTVLVICHKHKSLSMATRLGKALKAKAVVFESKPLYDNQVPAWIQQYLKSKKLTVQQEIAGLIGDYLGTDLSKIANELDKLALNLPAKSEVSRQDIETHIGISKDFSIFELQNAIGERNTVKVNRIVHYFEANPKKNPIQMVIGTLYGFFSKIYMMHFLRNTPENELINALGLRSAYFLKDYRLAARNFPLEKTEKAIGILKTYDLRSKGVEFNSTGKPENELLREMVWRILH